MKIVFVGAGNMAEAIVSGMLKSKIAKPKEVCMTDISAERLNTVTEKYGVDTSLDTPDSVQSADVVVLSVKPQIFPSVWAAIAKSINPDALIVSIMAGVPSSKIEEGNLLRVVRVMPNTPSLVGEGAAGVAGGTRATESDLLWSEKLMSSVGLAVRVTENELDAVTALSGSGPAYVFYWIESMLEAVNEMGLEKNLSRELALQTIIGAATLMKNSDESAEQLRAKVTSKGGTTAAAIETMEKKGVKTSIISALFAARDRSIELAEESTK